MLLGANLLRPFLLSLFFAASVSSTPSPTPYKPGEYSTDSAGETPITGDPLVETLHDFHHEGEDDYQPTADYGKSVLAVFAIIVAGGFWCLFCMWCINCCACCKCCREKLPCCFAIFKEHRSRGKAVVIVLFLFAAIAASSGWLGKNEFNDAVTESADELRYLGKSFTTLHGQSLELIDQSSSIATATDSATCDSGEANTALQSASDGLTLASEDVEGMLKGLGDDLNDMADFIEDNAPYYVNMGIYVVTGLVWVNVLLGLIAICTSGCKCDDCLTIFVGSLTLIVLMVLAGFEMMIAVTLSDFCYKGPENSLSLELDVPIFTYYLTCNGTNPLAVPFDAARDSVGLLNTEVQEIEDDPAVICQDSSLQAIIDNTDLTDGTLTAMEGTSGCSLINPRFQGFLHNIICDEAIRGMFYCFVSHAGSGILLIIAFCCLPIAANTKMHQESDDDADKSEAGSINTANVDRMRNEKATI